MNGNVGIGTNAPTRLLQVHSPGTSYLSLRGNNAGGDAAILEFYDTSSAHNWQIWMGDTTLDDDLKFSKGASGLPGAEFMRITDGGYVGIGANNPARLLDVRSTGTAYLRIGGNNPAGNANWESPRCGAL
jgi:hypothetical protein